MDMLEKVQQRATKMSKEREHPSLEERLRELALFSLQKGRLRANLITSSPSPRGGCKEDRARPFSVVLRDRTRGNRHKLKYRMLPLYCRKPFSL